MFKCLDSQSEDKRLFTVQMVALEVTFGTFTHNLHTVYNPDVTVVITAVIIIHHYHHHHCCHHGEKREVLRQNLSQ
jgi:hypothetical protein